MRTYRHEEVTYHAPAYSKQYDSRESLRYSSSESLPSSHSSSVRGAAVGRSTFGNRAVIHQGPLVSRKQVTTQDCLSHRSIQKPHCHRVQSGLVMHSEEEEVVYPRGRVEAVAVPAGPRRPPRSAPTSPAFTRRFVASSSTLIAHHSPTIPKKYPGQYPPRGRTMSPGSDSDSEFAPDKGFLMRRFLGPLGEQQLPERSRSASPYSHRPGSQFYEATVGSSSRADVESEQAAQAQPAPGDDSSFQPISAIKVRRSPCRSPGLRRRKMQDDVTFEKDRRQFGGDTYEGPQQFAGQKVGPEMRRKHDEKQPFQRGPGRRDPLAHQLSASSGSSLEESVVDRRRPAPVAAPAGLFSTPGIVTVGTSVSPCPSPTNLGITKRSAQDNVDYTKPAKEKAKMRLELPAGGLTVQPVPSPCPSPILFRNVEEDEEERSSQGRRSRSKSPRPRSRPEESKQAGHLSPYDDSWGSLLAPSKPLPIIGSGNLPSIEVLGSSPEKSELHHSPESAFQPMRDQASLEIARERRRTRRSQSRSPSPLVVVEGAQGPEPEVVTVGFRPISPTSPSVSDPVSSAVGDGQTVTSPADDVTDPLQAFPASHETRVQQMKVLALSIENGICFLEFNWFGIC